MTTEQSAPTVTTDDILELFRERGLEADADQARLDRILDEIINGERTLDDVARSLDRFATTDEPRETAPGDPFDIRSRPALIGDATIPSGGRLVELINPEGSDEDSLFRVIYEWNGVEYSYEIGNRERFDELFGDGGIQGFRQYSRLDQGEWDESGIFVVGNIDERLGATESEASLLERELRSLGFEQNPAWWDEEVSTIYLMGTAEGWSAGRLAKAMSETDAFRARFPGLDQYMEGRGVTDIIQATSGYVGEENALRASLRRFRGPTTDVSTEYLGELIKTGWTTDEVIPLIEAERRLREDPEAIDELNNILAFRGLDVVDEEGFIDVMSGAGSGDVYEAINDTLRAQALAEAGVDIDTAFADALGEGVSTGIAAPGTFSRAAQDTAATIARNFNALQIDQFGLERDDIVAYMFGEESPTGRSTGEIGDILGKIEREAGASAAGFSRTSAFLDQRGRLRIQGFSNT